MEKEKKFHSFISEWNGIRMKEEPTENMWMNGWEKRTQLQTYAGYDVLIP